MDPAAAPVLLTFADTTLLHKSSGQTGVSPYLGTGYASEKTLPNHGDDGTSSGIGILNNFETTQDIVAGSVARTYLECWRPLIYEPLVMLKSLCSTLQNVVGNRSGRQLPTCLMSGKFKIRMQEGINQPSLWVGTSQLMNNTVVPAAPNGQVQYAEDGFAAPQYVRAICIVVRDMGLGLGLANTSNATLQQATNPNYRNDDANGEGIGTADTCKMNLLAPALGDIFDGVQFDNDSDYYSIDPTMSTDAQYSNEEMIHWKYKMKSNTKSTPEEGLGNDEDTYLTFFDPLRGSSRKRNFHVVIDKKFAFKAGGSQSLRVNDQGALEVSFKWSVRLKNLRFQQQASGTTQGTIWRGREQMNQRVLWYFLASKSSYIDCLNRVRRKTGSATGTPTETNSRSMGHHNFSVERYPEKIFWTEKDTQ